MRDKLPPRVKDVEAWWVTPPPSPSPRLAAWVKRIDAGWRPNKRVRGMGYHDSADFFGIYIWEYLHVLTPVLWGYVLEIAGDPPRQRDRDRQMGERFLRAIRGESEVVA